MAGMAAQRHPTNHIPPHPPPTPHPLSSRSGTTVTKEVIEAGKKLKVIGRAGVGVDNVHIPSATQKGIIVMNTPGGNTTSAAELTMSLIMALARNIPQAVHSLKAGRWDRSKYMGTELAGKVVGIVGLGRIGREVARWCQSFGMIAVGYDPVMAPDVAAKAGITPVSLEELYARSDYITLHTPKTPETTNLLNAATLAKCKQGVRIVNVARGGIINEADLLAALNSGKVAGAALDVFSKEPPPPAVKPLLEHPNVICTPHLGASTNEAQVNVARDIAQQIADALDNKAFVGVVNATNLSFLSRPDLAAYTSMAERVGILQAQLMQGKLKKVQLSLQGPLVSDAAVASALKTAVLKGLLTVTQGLGTVNYVNTPYLAADLGIEVVEKVSPKSSAYTNLLNVTFETDAETRSISASVFTDNEPRLVSVDGFAVDVTPRGEMIFFQNTDKPGVLNRVTNVLGRSNINIANFGLGRHGVGGEALGVLTVDNPVPAEVVQQLRELPNVRNVRVASIPAMDVAPRVQGGSGASGASGASSNNGASRSALSDERAAAGLHVQGVPKPTVRPSSANFGSGPTKKRPGWSLAALSDAALGRSHRSKLGKDKLKRAIDKTRSILNLPKDYYCGLVPASDTGAFELAMWTMLGPKPVDSVHFESFGSGWHTDLTKQLKLTDVVEHKADYGSLPDLSKVNKAHDVIYTWNGTTSGVMVPNADWIAADRTGLTICDATSAVFSQPVDILKNDVITYSWQKVLGGEGAHGMLILSPRARERLETYTPKWPLPKIFRLTKKGKFMEEIFQGETINTPSMLAVEDYLDALTWAESQGGVAGLTARANANLAVVTQFVKEHDWISFLAKGEKQVGLCVCCVLCVVDAGKRERAPHTLVSPLPPFPPSPPRRRGEPLQHLHLPAAQPPQGEGQGAHHAAREGGRRVRHRLLPRRAPGPPPLGRRHGRGRGHGHPPPVDPLGLPRGAVKTSAASSCPSPLCGSLPIDHQRRRLDECVASVATKNEKRRMPSPPPITPLLSPHRHVGLPLHVQAVVEGAREDDPVRARVGPLPVHPGRGPAAPELGPVRPLVRALALEEVRHKVPLVRRPTGRDVEACEGGGGEEGTARGEGGGVYGGAYPPGRRRTLPMHHVVLPLPLVACVVVRELPLAVLPLHPANHNVLALCGEAEREEGEGMREKSGKVVCVHVVANSAAAPAHWWRMHPRPGAGVGGPVGELARERIGDEGLVFRSALMSDFRLNVPLSLARSTLSRRLLATRCTYHTRPRPGRRSAPPQQSVVHSSLLSMVPTLGSARLLRRLQRRQPPPACGAPCDRQLQMSRREAGGGAGARGVCVNGRSVRIDFRVSSPSTPTPPSLASSVVPDVGPLQGSSLPSPSKHPLVVRPRLPRLLQDREEVLILWDPARLGRRPRPPHLRGAHKGEELDLLVAQVRVPDVRDEGDPGRIGVVGRLVLEGVVEGERAALADRAGVGAHAQATERTSSTAAAVRPRPRPRPLPLGHNQGHVDSQLPVGGPRVRRDVRARRHG
jgi:D-3-phosphoglycerate dehydrogenase